MGGAAQESLDEPHGGARRAPRGKAFPLLLGKPFYKQRAGTQEEGGGARDLILLKSQFFALAAASVPFLGTHRGIERIHERERDGEREAEETALADGGWALADGGDRKVIPPRVLIAALCVLGLWGISGSLSLSGHFQGLAM